MGCDAYDVRQLAYRGGEIWQGHRGSGATDGGVLKLQGEDLVTMATDDPDLQLRSMLQLTFLAADGRSHANSPRLVGSDQKMMIVPHLPLLHG